MASDVLERTIGQVHAWAAARETAALPDCQLLQQFVATRHEPSFAALVHRHAPLVFNVCRRMLGDRHDAEDALQATFLILAGKAATVRNVASLASWLHGTAVRVSLNLRRRRGLRHAREAAVARPDRTQPADEVTWREVQAAFDEELHRLPEHYRAPLVLCHLEGRSRDEAAALLGWSAGTLHGRLERAKKKLHARLTARGLTLSACLAAIALPTERVAAATLVALSHAAASGDAANVFAGAMQIAAEASRAGTAPLARLGACFAVGMFAATVALFAAAQAPRPDASAGPVAAAPTKPSAPIVVAAVIKEDQLRGMLIAVDPETGAWKKVADADARVPRVSPDGQTVVFAKVDDVWNCDAAGSNNPGKLFDFTPYAGFSWTPTGDLIGTKIVASLNNEIWQHETWRYDADGRNPQKLKLPVGDAVLDVSADGQWALTRSRIITALNTSDLRIVKLDGSQALRLSDVGGFNEPGRFSPDGKRVAWCRRHKGVDSVWIVNRDGSGKRRIFEVDDVHAHSVCWSPDGKTVAVVLMDWGTGPDGRRNRFQSGPDGNWRIELVDVADGSHRTVPIKARIWSLRDPDWRKPAAAAQDRQTDDNHEHKAREAIRKAVTFLKSQQHDGHWEPRAPLHRPGQTSLALWALLEAGVPTTDEAVANGLKYIRGFEPSSVYGVSLQTAALARARLPQDREMIRRNVNWLIDAMVRDGQGKLRGWSYQSLPAAGRSDNSNTQYAVMGLHAAAEAGVPIDADVWRQIKDYYLRTQHEDGGWSYATLPGHTSFSMTCGGISGLAIADKHLKQKSDAALARAQQRLAILYNPHEQPPRFYNFHSLARAGALASIQRLENKEAETSADWRRDIGARLLALQRNDGRWETTFAYDQDPVIATSFAILFLKQ